MPPPLPISQAETTRSHATPAEGWEGGAVFYENVLLSYDSRISCPLGLKYVQLGKGGVGGVGSRGRIDNSYLETQIRGAKDKRAPLPRVHPRVRRAPRLRPAGKAAGAVTAGIVVAHPAGMFRLGERI